MLFNLLLLAGTIACFLFVGVMVAVIREHGLNRIALGWLLMALAGSYIFAATLLAGGTVPKPSYPLMLYVHWFVLGCLFGGMALFAWGMWRPARRVS